MQVARARCWPGASWRACQARTAAGCRVHEMHRAAWTCAAWPLMPLYWWALPSRGLWLCGAWTGMSSCVLD